MQQYYKKQGRKYIPVGYNDGFQGFPSEGIWMVKKGDGLHSSECIIRLGELQDMQPAANLILGYKQKIIDFLLKESDNNNLHVFNKTLNEFTLQMLKEITKNDKKETE